MNAKLYFAYGSNLNRYDWERWCERKGASPDVLRFRSVGYLPDHDVCFSRYSTTRKGGVLDIKPRVGQYVPGVIDVCDNGWDQLDNKEGYPNSYVRIAAVVLDDRGREVAVETYQVLPANRKPFVQPRQNYVELVREGLDSYGLPTELMDAASQDRQPPWLVDAFFTYGTLMRDESRFQVWRSFGLKCSLLAYTFGQLLDLGSYPGLIGLSLSDSTVQGDFIRVHSPEIAIQELDQIEGFRGFGCSGSLYRRTLCQVDVGEGRIRSAWTYCLAHAEISGKIIPSGDWRQHRGVRGSFLSKLAQAHAQGDENRVARCIAEAIPFAFNPDSKAVVKSLLPLSAALNQGHISERKLAQESGIWNACT